MDILQIVSKKDAKWREIALNITKNKYDADDLVNDMYLRLVKYNITKWNYSFIILVMWNIHKDNKKGIKYNSQIDEQKLKEESVTIEEKNSFNDRELFILSEIEKLTDEEKKLLELNYDLSICQIAKNIGECRIKTYRKAIDIRKRVLTDGYDEEYRNRRLKYRNGR